MTKRNWFLICGALALAGVYVFYFTDWFMPKIIHITSVNARTSRVVRARNSNLKPATVPVFFKLGKPYTLAEIKVVELDEWQTNNKCLPLWHLITDTSSTNSAPIERPFAYGQPIRGMKSEVSGARAQPLQPGVKYRLFVTDGSAKGQHDFQPIAAQNN